MSMTGTTRISRKPRETPPPSKSDWARVDAMTDDDVIAAALSDPDAQPLSVEQLARLRRASRK